MLFIFVMNAVTVMAAVDSIYGYMKKIDEHYVVVAGLNATSSDSFAATDILLGIQNELGLSLEATIENMITPNINKILVGNPCANSLVRLSCDKWPYDDDIALIKILGNDLIVAGTAPEDTRMAAKVVARFMDYPELKEMTSILVVKSGENITLERVKRDWEFVCGDNICDHGEKYLCSADCKQVTCFIKCSQEGFDLASCRQPPSNPNLPFCGEGEKNEGPGYCATGKVCCCGTEGKSQPEEETTTVEIPQESPSFLMRLWLFFKEVVSVIF